MRKYGEPHWTYRDCHFAETKGVSDISNNKEPLTKEVLANGNTLMLSGNISEWVLDYHVPNQPLNKQSVIEVFQDIGQPLVPPGDTSEKQEKEFTGKMRFTIIDLSLIHI